MQRLLAQSYSHLTCIAVAAELSFSEIAKKPLAVHGKDSTIPTANFTVAFGWFDAFLIEPCRWTLPIALHAAVILFFFFCCK